MSEEVQQSLIVRTGMALAAVILLAVVNMVASYLTAESTENDAVRINLAGSLRMQTYRMANEFILSRADPGIGSRDKLQQTVDDFQTRLEQTVLADHIRSSSNDVLQRAFEKVVKGWQQLKPQILSQEVAQADLLLNADGFVDDIDSMVKILELQTESKFRVLRFIQGASLLLTLGLATLMFWNVYRYVVGPLHQLVTMASRLRAGDFSMRLDSKGDDELSLLANTFNDMAASLDDIYRSLEDKVQVKTRHLEDIQEGLRFLYDCSRRLSAQGNLVEKLERTVNQLQRHLQADRIDLLLVHESPEHPFHISTAPQVHSPARPYKLARAGTDLADFEQFPLQHNNRIYGYLRVFESGTTEFDKEQHLILTAVADTMGAALANEVRKDQEHRVALMDERAAIARELHDSLAQSLSFTKIQISRFQALQQKNAPRELLEDALGEIKVGIQAAYGQLRELLATFRLQLDSPGLKESLASTAQEFEDRGNLSIDLKYDLQNYPLTPNEEIHILQIVREALSNVLRHSGGDCASIHLAVCSDSCMIEISVIDNGCGFNAAASGRNHYGQTIMRERAKILGGTIEFIDRKESGAQVRVRFQAEQGKQQVQQFKALGQ